MEKIIFTGVHGSHLYGTNTPESDSDFKSIFLPSKKDILLGNGAKHFTRNTGDHVSKNTADDVDNEFFSLAYFIDLAKKGETFVIDMLHTPADMTKVDSELWQYIRANRHMFYTTDMKAYLGYVRKQAGKYGVKGSRLSALRTVRDHVSKVSNSRTKTKEEFDSEMQSMREKGQTKHIKANVDYRIRDFISELPILDGFTSIFKDDKGNTFYEVLSRKYQDTMTIAEFKTKLESVWNEYGERARKAEANEGIDWKALHHACRGGMQLYEIYQTGDLVYPMQEREYLLKIKRGELPFKEVQEYLEQLVDDVDRSCKIASKNGMSSKVDSKFWDNFIQEVHYNIVLKG